MKKSNSASTVKTKSKLSSYDEKRELMSPKGKKQEDKLNMFSADKKVPLERQSLKQSSS